MKVHKYSRRMLLQGVGKTTLAIPFLPSLASLFAGTAYAEGDAIPRFIFVGSGHGPYLNSHTPELSQHSHSVGNGGFLTTDNGNYLRHGNLPTNIRDAGAAYDIPLLMNNPALRAAFNVYNGFAVHQNSSVVPHLQSAAESSFMLLCYLIFPSAGLWFIL